MNRLFRKRRQATLLFVLLALTVFPVSQAVSHEPPAEDSFIPELHSSPLGQGEEIGSRREPGRITSVSGTATTLYTNRLHANTKHEVEAAIVALKVNGTDHTVSAFMRDISDPGAKARWRIKTFSSPDLANWTVQTPGLPAGHSTAVDPVLAANPYTSPIAPETVFLGGLTYATDAYERRILPESVVVWRSSSGGQSWSTPVVVAQNVSDHGYSLDKPTIAVSWHTSTRGYVYVAYMQVDGTNANRLYVARSVDGGQTFQAPVLVVQGTLHAPQVLVSSHTGNVYVVYVDYTLNSIRMATSINQGMSWTLETVTNPTGKFLDAYVDRTISGDETCTGGLRAVTVPHARFNSVKGSLGIVWHERQTNSVSSPTDVYFIAKTASGWSAKKRVNVTQANDQWMPALDFDPAGNYVVVFRDRSQDPANKLFRQAWVQIDHDGDFLGSGYVANAFNSDPTVYDKYTYCFAGEYQDIWYWTYSDATGGRFNAIWTGRPNAAYDDVYISGIK